jgi:hypothetical protein
MARSAHTEIDLDTVLPPAPGGVLRMRMRVKPPPPSTTPSPASTLYRVALRAWRSKPKRVSGIHT